MERNQSDSSKPRMKTKEIKDAGMIETIKIGSQRLLADRIDPVKINIDQQSPQPSWKIRKNSFSGMIAQPRQSILDLLCQRSNSVESDSYSPSCTPSKPLSQGMEPLSIAYDERETRCAPATEQKWHNDLTCLLNQCDSMIPEKKILDLEPRSIEEMMKDSDTTLNKGSSWNVIF